MTKGIIIFGGMQTPFLGGSLGRYLFRFGFGVTLRSCRKADPATDLTALDFDVLSSLPAVRPTRFEVAIKKTPKRLTDKY